MPCPWIINEVEEKIQNALGMEHLHGLHIEDLDSKSWIANELLDALTCYDLPEKGLSKLILFNFSLKCEPFEDEVMIRVANMCTNISHLELQSMEELS